MVESNNNVLSEVDQKIINQIFANQNSELMNVIKNMTVEQLNQCCENKLKKLNGDFILNVKEVKSSIRYGRKKGSFVLQVQDAMNYIRNKNPNWEKSVIIIFIQ